MTCSAVFFVSFPKYPKINGNNKKISGLFWEFSFVLATKTNSKSSEDVSQIIDPKSVQDIQVEKDHKQIGLCRKISNLYEVSSVFSVCFISYKTN